ncbi:uncharacterized protein cubi_00933 [Cryptosporidium ubiquitum]|uniref:Uncharacterized protein n=1 Tax=Cryptosporidium ubiquitum TaxID=857276 RepID=A0A1J4MCP9_9CRYT|nr:uncharacterized protein cubi_00933 [Cryptosporidium ubiquitum]OII70788.1 hypothetical protein cubi_00933 [Cryptosporidium ubiquitum]
MKKNSTCGLLLNVPFTSPICTINSIDNKVLVGTWDGYFYQVCLSGEHDVVVVQIEPSYPIRYISALKNADNNRELNTKAQISYELILGGVYKTKVRVKNRTNSPIIPLDELEVSPDAHYQIIETRSSLECFDFSNRVSGLKNKYLRSPLFLFSSTINSYFGFNGEKGEIEISLGNFYIPDREFVILDYDFLNNHLLIVERSPERLDYYALCSLQIIELPRSQNNLVKEIDPNEITNLTEIPPKYILNFPIKNPLLITSNIKSELTLSSSAEYNNFKDFNHIYKYLYSTMFKMSDFRKDRFNIFKSMYNLCDAKFWGCNSFVFLVSNHTIIGVDILFSKDNELITYTSIKNKFCIKSPDRNITSISTTNYNYMVALTEKNRVFLSNRNGEIVYSINNITPNKSNFKWVWPVHVFVMHTGIVLFSTTKGLYYFYCDLLDKEKVSCVNDQSFTIDLPN